MADYLAPAGSGSWLGLFVERFAVRPLPNGLTFLSLAVFTTKRDSQAGLARWKRYMSAIHNTLLITGLTLAAVLTVAWDGLLAYGLIAVIRAL